MTRRLVFDPTDANAFLGQRLRLDWRMLRNGFVYRCGDSADLNDTSRRLADLDYLVHRPDAAGWTTSADLHAGLCESLSLPDHLVRDPYTFDDTLAQVAMYFYGSDPKATGTVLAIDNYQTLVESDEHAAHDFLDAFARQAALGALVGHPMLCLVTTTTDLAPIGARPLHPVHPHPTPTTADDKQE